MTLALETQGKESDSLLTCVRFKLKSRADTPLMRPVGPGTLPDTDRVLTLHSTQYSVLSTQWSYLLLG